ncbi:hypothetical protein [Roseimicrobium sp. ORNL1]|uniref:hypothetical protein n=1 Tax=Roseimicrobium sp. ORNL1 TaxID=2711231 RepID=UPI0013E100FB|nr:hypothetical protein [Roseimicrobium sp. ORNL1]QIF05762.1 hypothetical protein G5S37_31120 [Roseimicrobium sp. ORNL1]
MKSKLLTLLALGIATVSQAATYNVYITGSTAGRSSVHTALTNSLPGATITKDNAAIGSASKANFTGGTFNGDTYNVYCSWSGSATGIGSLVNNSNVAFMTAIGGTTENPTTTPTFNHAADITFSDVFQSSTNFSAVTLNDFTTIVLPFLFYTSEGSPITNVTPQLAQYLYIVGTMPLALFTGNSADEGKGVVACGRDNGSGTRITTMAETGVGAFSSLVQYTPTLTGANVAINGVNIAGDGITVTHTATTTALIVNQPIRGSIVPAGTKVATVIDSTHFTLSNAASSTGLITDGTLRGGQNAAAHTNSGNGGANSGGIVAGYVAATTVGLSQGGRTPCYYLSYLGVADGVTAALDGAVQCQYNGVTYTAANVRNGLYSLWGYLHLMTRPDVTTGPEALAAQLVTALDGLPGTSGLQLSSMRVSRQADGGIIVNEAY